MRGSNPVGAPRRRAAPVGREEGAKGGMPPGNYGNGSSSNTQPSSCATLPKCESWRCTTSTATSTRSTRFSKTAHRNPTSSSSAATRSRARSQRDAGPPRGARAHRTGSAGTGSARSRRRAGAPEPAADDWAAITAALTPRQIGAHRARPLWHLPLTESSTASFTATPRRATTTRSSLASPHTSATRRHSRTSTRDRRRRPHASAGRRRVGGTRFINAGSVGLPYEGDGAARWLWVEDGVPGAPPDRLRRQAAGERMLAPLARRTVDRRGTGRTRARPRRSRSSSSRASIRDQAT